MPSQLISRIAVVSRHTTLPFLYPYCLGAATVPSRRRMMSFGPIYSVDNTSLSGSTSTSTSPSLSTSHSNSSASTLTPTPAPAGLVADAAAPQTAGGPPPAPKVEKARPKIRSSKAALTISAGAVARLRGLLTGPTPRLIRIGVKNKGCAGLSYSLEYVEKGGKFDEVVEQDGVTVLVDSKALFSIIGSRMDWTEDALSSRFTFENPNIKDACGCGESFTVS